MNAGLGNFGVTTMQILIPLVMTVGIFGALGGDPMELQKASGTLIGWIEAGTDTWIQNAGFIWLVFLIPLAFAGWFGMNNIRAITPNPGSPLQAFSKILGLYAVGFLAVIIGVVALGWLNMWVALPMSILLTLLMLRMILGDIKPNIQKQFAIFSNKHTWAMTVLYIATFGSFIGFSAALPLSISVIFGNMMEVTADGTITRVANPDAPSALTWAWIGPFVGALIRPVGGWISDKLGGAIVTQAISVVMVVASAAVGYVMMLAYNATDPNQYFWMFLLLFIILFAASGIGNGSTFRSIGFIFDLQQKGPVLGWTSAVAAYGAFIAPRVMGEQIKAGTPEMAMSPTLVLVGVVENPRDSTDANEDMFNEEYATLKTSLQEGVEVAQKEDLEAEWVIAEGDALKMLLDASKRISPEMLVIARHSQAPDGGLIAQSLSYFVDELDYMTFGSVSSFLTRRAECPLLIMSS